MVKKSHNMDIDEVMTKQHKLMEIAELQYTYRAWRELFALIKRDFDAYAEQQPPDIQSTLYSCLQACQMQNQRLLNIACEYMDFIDPEYRK